MALKYLWTFKNRIFELHIVGTLLMYLKMPVSLQRESIQTDQRELENHKQRYDLLSIQNFPVICHILPIFSTHRYLLDIQCHQ